MAQEPGGSSRLLITYMEVCVDNGAILVEGFGLVEYDSANNTIAAGPTEVFRAPAGSQVPAQQQLGSPIFSGGDVFLFSSVCDSSGFGACGQGRIFLAGRSGRPPAAWRVATPAPA
jgi:hypothetical protein